MWSYFTSDKKKGMGNKMRWTWIHISIEDHKSALSKLPSVTGQNALKATRRKQFKVVCLKRSLSVGVIKGQRLDSVSRITLWPLRKLWAETGSAFMKTKLSSQLAKSNLLEGQTVEDANQKSEYSLLFLLIWTRTLNSQIHITDLPADPNTVC